MCPPPCRCQPRATRREQVFAGLAQSIVPRYLAALLRGRHERQQRRLLVAELSQQIRAEAEVELEPLRRIADRLQQAEQELPAEIRIVTPPNRALALSPRRES